MKDMSLWLTSEISTAQQSSGSRCKHPVGQICMYCLWWASKLGLSCAVVAMHFGSSRHFIILLAWPKRMPDTTGSPTSICILTVWLFANISRTWKTFLFDYHDHLPWWTVRTLRALKGLHYKQSNKCSVSRIHLNKYIINKNLMVYPDSLDRNLCFYWYGQNDWDFVIDWKRLFLITRVVS